MDLQNRKTFHNEVKKIRKFCIDNNGTPKEYIRMIENVNMLQSFLDIRKDVPNGIDVLDWGEVSWFWNYDIDRWHKGGYTNAFYKFVFRDMLLLHLTDYNINKSIKREHANE